MFSIGDLSRRTGVKVPTIRYYEQMGLIAAPERSEGNQRRYSRQELERLAFIRHARDLGFPLEDVRRLLALWQDRDRTSAEVKRLALAHVAALETKAESLRRMAASLRHLAAQEHHGALGNHALAEVVVELLLGVGVLGVEGADALVGSHSDQSSKS